MFSHIDDDDEAVFQSVGPGISELRSREGGYGKERVQLPDCLVNELVFNRLDLARNSAVFFLKATP